MISFDSLQIIYKVYRVVLTI